MGKRLSNKVAIVTGAGSGIGKETSLLFLEEGAQVILADINETTLEETFNIAVQKGYKENVVSIPTNVAKESDIVNMVNIAISEFGHLDILFNNAGVGGASGT